MKYERRETKKEREEKYNEKKIISRKKEKDK